MVPIIVKVGGSLFDLPDLGVRLRRWIAKQSAAEMALVPGGGATTDIVRSMDRGHALGEDAAHWLALSALTLNARLLVELLTTPGAPPLDVVLSRDVVTWPSLWQRGALPVLDAFAFAEADESRPDHLPHSWDVTSDSIAARVATVTNARRLVLLKSVSIPAEMSWLDAGRAGYVDPFFAQTVGELDVQVINFRCWSPGSGMLDPGPGRRR